MWSRYQEKGAFQQSPAKGDRDTNSAKLFNNGSEGVRNCPSMIVRSAGFTDGFTQTLGLMGMNA